MGKNKELQKNKSRLHLLDTVRGLAIIGMVFIHVTYDLPEYFGIYPAYADSLWYEIFGQLVRITFIFLSGYCAMLGKKTLKRGLIVSGAGLLVTLVSVIAKVNPPIYFGVLTLIGACMLLSVPLKKVITKKNAAVFMITGILLFILTLHLYNGYFGFVGHPFFYWPSWFYQGNNPVLLYPLAFLGFPGGMFSSSDYFPLIPWFFLFLSGMSFYALFGETLKKKDLMKIKAEPLAFLGRYSLWVYLLHQPLIMGILMAIAAVRR